MKKRIELLLKKWHIAAIGVFFACNSLFAQWNTTVIGTMPGTNALGIAMADGRNDGVNRVYATTDTEIYEWSYNGTSWTSTLVTTGLSPTLLSIAAGDGRNDGTTRIYFVDWATGGALYEATWNGSSWNTLTIGTPPGGTHSSGVTLGSGRNDGVTRVYTLGSYGVYEYSWNGSSWNQLAVANNWSETNGFVGDARNDGTDRLIFNASCNWESTWNGSSYTTVGLSPCGSSQSADAVEIGTGRNDGVNRVYVNTEVAGRIEYTWNGSAYTATTIRPTGHRGDIHLAQLHSDQQTRVYMTNASHGIVPAGDLMEYTWNSTTSQWSQTSTVLSAVSGATSFIEAGDGRNDNVIRLYAPNFSTGEILEITSTTPNNLCATMSTTNTTIAANCTASNGSATVTGIGGTAPYSYQWDTAAGNQTTSTATGLTAGSYNCTVSDAAGCTALANVVVNAAPSTLTNTMTTVDATCGSTNGSATANPANGAAPYTYQWDAAAGNQTSALATGLGAGGYSVTITDNNGCTVTDVASISNIGAPSVTMAQTDVLCFGDSNGSATVAASGGTPPYSYAWNDPNASTGATASGLGAGTYVVTITDQTGCAAVASVTIIAPNPLVSTMVPTITSSAAIDVTVTGGNPPYVFAWNTGATTEDLTGLSNGTYSVTISDANNCVLQDTLTISTVAIPEIEPMRFMLYPNPANHVLYFRFDQTADYQIEFYTLSGERIKSLSNDGMNEIAVDVSAMAPGMYMAKVTHQNQIGFERFTIFK